MTLPRDQCAAGGAPRRADGASYLCGPNALLPDGIGGDGGLGLHLQDPSSGTSAARTRLGRARSSYFAHRHRARPFGVRARTTYSRARAAAGNLLATASGSIRATRRSCTHYRGVRPGQISTGFFFLFFARARARGWVTGAPANDDYEPDPWNACSIRFGRQE